MAKTAHAIIYTDSGGVCRNEAKSPSSIAPGIAAFWSSAWKASPRKRNGSAPTKKSILSSGNCATFFRAILAKFWIHISREEQLRRFEERKAIGYKAWKLTEEDWRNRDKWDAYEEAVEEMLVKTSTVTAPWTVVEGNDKYWARAKVLAKVVEVLATEMNYRPADPLGRPKEAKPPRKPKRKQIPQR